MAENTALQIILISGACCMPHMAKLDKELEKNLQQAVADLGIPADVRKVSLSTLLAGKDGLLKEQRDQILALFQGYGASFTPALLIHDQVCFAGTQPTVSQLKETLQASTAS